MRGNSRLALAALALAMTFTASANVSAHRTEDYLQAARIGLEPDRVLVTVDLTPGIAAAESFLAELDRERDGSLSSDEQRTYAGRVARDLSVEIDGQPLHPAVLSWSFPDPSALRRGEGAIRLSLGATLPGVAAGSHRLFFRNAHLVDHSAYLANALVSESRRVTVTEQRRDREQTELTIEYTLQPEPATTAPAWVAGSLAAAFLIVKMWSRAA